MSIYHRLEDRRLYTSGPILSLRNLLRPFRLRHIIDDLFSAQPASVLLMRSNYFPHSRLAGLRSSGRRFILMNVLNSLGSKTFQHGPSFGLPPKLLADSTANLSLIVDHVMPSNQTSTRSNANKLAPIGRTSPLRQLRSRTSAACAQPEPARIWAMLLAP